MNKLLSKILFKTVIVILPLILVVIVSNIILSNNSEEVKNDKFKWQLTFEDNFDSFDRSKWQTMFDMNTRTIWSNKELQWYKDENVFADNGVLKIITKKESIFGKDAESEKQFEFTSGMINTARTFTQSYGKWEIKVKFPYKKGYWPAFWLVAKERPGLPEIDVFEYFGRKENSMSSSLHWGINYPSSEKDNSAPFYYVKSNEITGDFSDNWMIWSLECFPDKILWKLNDKIVFESTQGIPTGPMYIIANVAIKAWDENNGEVDRSDDPYVMEIDYIKAYKIIPE